MQHVNLRGSLETELAQDHPVRVIAHWLGNTPKIAAAHYLQVRDSDFDRALASCAKSGALEAQKAAEDRRGERRRIAEYATNSGENGTTAVFVGNAGEAEYPR